MWWKKINILKKEKFVENDIAFVDEYEMAFEYEISQHKVRFKQRAKLYLSVFSAHAKKYFFCVQIHSQKKNSEQRKQPTF